MRKRGFGLLFSAMLILTCIGCGAKSMTAKAQEAVLNEANIVEEAVATAPVPETKYTFTDIAAVMYAQNTVNVRNLPSTSGNKLGRLSVNDEIAVTGQCNETGWYRFDYNGSVAYVSNKYVSENKVEIQTTPTDNSGSVTGSASGAFNEADFPTPYAIINKGGTNVYYVMGTDGILNSNAHHQCDTVVAENLGIETMHTGGGWYYWFNGNGYINGAWVENPNANGVLGLFFPAYQDASGNYLGMPADARTN